MALNTNLALQVYSKRILEGLKVNQPGNRVS